MFICGTLQCRKYIKQLMSDSSIYGHVYVTLNDIFQWFNIASIVYAPAILSTKIAILLLYRRVFSPHRRGTFDRSIRLFILILCLFYLATTLVKIWECSPRQRIWNKSVEGTCINIPALLDASGICNTLTDLIILFMPIQAVWHLKTTTRRKIGVVLVFSVGFM